MPRRAGRGRLPDFLIIGAQRAGTTSLAAYLMSHPALFLPRESGRHFFSQPEVYERGLRWYATRFSTAPDRALAGEHSPKCLVSEAAAGRIGETLPDAKLIAILRNPIDRAYSEYRMFRAWYGERRSFVRAIEDEQGGNRVAGVPNAQPQYLGGGLYLDQLRHYWDYRSKEAVLILFFDDLVRDPPGVYQSVCSFLGADPSFVPPNLGARYNYVPILRSSWLWFALQRWRDAGGWAGRAAFAIDNSNVGARALHPPLPRSLRRELEDFYRGPNQRLAEWLGRDLPAWEA